MENYSLSLLDTNIDMQYFKLYPYVDRDEYQVEFQLNLYRNFIQKYRYSIFTKFRPFQVEIVSILGQGAFATVYLVRFINEGNYTLYALKMEQMNTALYNETTFDTKVKTEFQTQKKVEKLGYSTFIPEYGFFTVLSEIFSYIVMDVLPSTNVYPCINFIRNPEMLKPRITYSLLKKITKASFALESNGIVHGDFHWGNIMVSVKEAHIDIPFTDLKDDQFDIILIDFGFSTSMVPELKNYDLNSLYISSLSFPNEPKFRSRIRKLMMKRTSVSEKELLDIEAFYDSYAKQKHVLFRKLNLD
jgi:serine/threonine protein kinase